MIAIFKSLLPPRYRGGEIPRSAALISGLGETILGLLVLVGRAMVWLQARTAVDMRTASVLGGFDVPGSGIFLLAEFWFNPLHLFLFYIAIEGMVRTLAALASHQVIGSLPLYAISGVHALVDKKKYSRYIGELVPDQVAVGGENAGYDLKVYSCRPKLNWNPYITIEFNGACYQYFKEEYGAAPRRFIYYLRRYPAGVPAVVIDRYQLDSVLKGRG